MNETVLEAEARYLIEDRIHPDRREFVGARRHHRKPHLPHLPTRRR